MTESSGAGTPAGFTPAALLAALAAGANHCRNALTLLELSYKSGGDQATNDALIRVLTRRLWQAVFVLEAPAANAPAPRPALVPDDAAATRELTVSRFMARGEQLAGEQLEQLEPSGRFVDVAGRLDFVRPRGAAAPRADGAA